MNGDALAARLSASQSRMATGELWYISFAHIYLIIRVIGVSALRPSTPSHQGWQPRTHAQTHAHVLVHVVMRARSRVTQDRALRVKLRHRSPVTVARKHFLSGVDGLRPRRTPATVWMRRTSRAPPFVERNWDVQTMHASLHATRESARHAQSER